MPVDYSKWDALELSDDSDVEVHPNVDKKSFIRAKQNQIHQERLERKMRIDGLDYQRRLHEGLFQRVTSLLSILKGGLTDEEKAEDEKDSGKGLAKCAFRAVMESAGGFADDKLPKLPDGIEVDDNRPVSYSQMMAGLLDQVNKTLDEKQPEDRYTAMLEEVESHETQIMELIEDARAQMIALQSVDSKKITSEGIHVGFDSSHVNKSTSATGGDSTQVELLNPNFDTSGAAASKDDKGKGAAQEGGNEDEDTEASPLAKEFGKIKASDYAASLQFLGKHSEIISEKETDGLLILAFDAALEKDDDASRQYVHQALLLQYCRALGRDGVALFFKRITTKNHQAQGVFYRDVQDTYMRIKNRSREIIAERAKEGEGVEQIQLHAVEPGTVINIRVPPVESEDADEQEARKIFEAFSPEMRTALETGELDEVNKVLGALSIDEAEELVNWFGEANILSLEEQIIDATTDEGQQKLKELEKQAAEEAKEGKVEEIGDPA